MSDNKRQTTRPFGVSLAIVLSLILFSFIPLLQVFFTVYIRTQMGDSGMQIGGSGDAIGGALGIVSITDVQLLLRGIPALLYVGVAVMAWRGWPPVARYVMSVSVVGLWLYGTVLGLLRERTFSAAGGVSSDGVLRWLQSIDFVISALVVVYVVWYMNRAPARAFYRGRGTDSV